MRLVLMLLLCVAAARAWKLDRLQLQLQRQGRAAVVATGLAAAIFSPGFPQASWADNVAGSKTDKKFELCVSKCIFSETRPPPAGSSTERLEARERGPIIKECRKSCAKTKEQLMTGEPKKVKTPQQAAPAFIQEKEE